MDTVELDLIYGLIGIFLLNFRNHDKNYLRIISVFIIGLFLSQILFFAISNLVGNIIYIISSLGLLTSYILRFNKKEQRGIIEVFKMFTIILLVIYPFPFISLFSIGRNDYWETLRFMTFFVLATAYLYDRWILKPENMKRKFIVVLTIQTILIGLLLIFSFMQRIEVDRQRTIAVEGMQTADELEYKLIKEINELKEEIENCR